MAIHPVMPTTSDRKKVARSKLVKLRRVLVLGGMALAAACAGAQRTGHDGNDQGTASGNPNNTSGGGAGGW